MGGLSLVTFLLTLEHEEKRNAIRGVAPPIDHSRIAVLIETSTSIAATILVKVSSSVA
jgi:hypothetical protein